MIRMHSAPARLARAALFLAILIAPVAPALAGDSLSIGATMPSADQMLLGVDGSKLSLGEVRGEKGTLVVFTCNTCPWVKAWDERIAALGNEYSERGIGVVSINSNDPNVNKGDSLDAMKERAAKLGLRFPYVVDGTSGLAQEFGATRTPEAFLFDASGQLAYHGTIDDNARNPGQVEKTFLKDALEAVANGQPVAVAETKALGCGIKFRN